MGGGDSGFKCLVQSNEYPSVLLCMYSYLEGGCTALLLPCWLPIRVEPISMGKITLLFSGYNFLGAHISLSFFLTSSWPFRSREPLSVTSMRLPLCLAASHRWSPFFFFFKGNNYVTGVSTWGSYFCRLQSCHFSRLLAVDKGLIQRQWNVPESCKYVHVSQPENVIFLRGLFYFYLFLTFPLRLNINFGEIAISHS